MKRSGEKCDEKISLSVWWKGVVKSVMKRSLCQCDEKSVLIMLSSQWPPLWWKTGCFCLCRCHVRLWMWRPISPKWAVLIGMGKGGNDGGEEMVCSQWDGGGGGWRGGVTGKHVYSRNAHLLVRSSWYVVILGVLGFVLNAGVFTSVLLLFALLWYFLVVCLKSMKYWEEEVEGYNL